MLSKYGDQIDGFWAADDAMMLGAIEAVKKAGRNRHQVRLRRHLPADHRQWIKARRPIVGETFHRGYMAASIGLFTAYQAATGELDVSKMPQEQRDSLFKLACVTPAELPGLHQVRLGHPGLDRHADRERTLRDRTRPAGRPRPGEAAVLIACDLAGHRSAGSSAARPDGHRRRRKATRVGSHARTDEGSEGHRGDLTW